MNGSPSKTRVELTGNDLIFERMYDAPREMVFKAWTDPRELARWWGPACFTNPVCEVDLRPGGEYRIIMRSPDGVDYPVKGVYLEVVFPERLVMTDVVDDAPANWHEKLGKLRGQDTPANMKAVLIVTFEDVGGKAKMTIVNRFDDILDRDANVQLGAVGGWSESFDKLETLLAGD